MNKSKLFLFLIFIPFATNGQIYERIDSLASEYVSQGFSDFSAKRILNFPHPGPVEPSSNIKEGQSILKSCPDGSILPDSSDVYLLNTAQQVLRISNKAVRFWPSYWKEFPPFILAEPEKTVLLVSQNQPPAPYIPICGGNLLDELKGISYVVRGEVPDLQASRGYFDLNYIVGNDTLTAVSIRETIPATIEFFFHEAFHAFQHRVFPERIQVEYLVREIYNSENYQEYDSIERKLLSEAVGLPPGEESRNLLRAYITIRNKRSQHFSKNAIDAERELEIREGTAQLVSEYAGLLINPSKNEDTLAGRIQELLQSNYDKAFNEQFRYRGRLYGTGAAMSLILDRYNINWQEQVLQGAFLDEILQTELNIDTIDNQDELQRLIEPFRQ